MNLNYQYLMGTLNPPLQPFVPQPPTNQNHHHHFLPPPPSSSSSLSLWMGQDIAPTSQTQPQDYEWVFANAKAASGCINNNNHNDHITQTANASSTTTATLSVPSLFSSDQTQSPNANVNMSATALLQKAAEIGANSTTATSTNPSAFLKSFPLKSSDQTTTSYDDGEKFFALFGSNNNIGVVSNSHDQETENVRNDVTVASAMDELQNYPWKRRKVDGGGEGGGGGQTRDFLGVGVQTLCHPSSINGWI